MNKNKKGEVEDSESSPPNNQKLNEGVQNTPEESKWEADKMTLEKHFNKFTPRII